MTPLEKMARAIYEGRNGVGCKAWGTLPAAHRLPYFTDAKQAARAIREPDHPTSQVGGAVLLANECAPWEASDVFTAMIDNILERG